MKKKNNKIKDLLSNQKGAALVTVLIFTFLMLTFVVALMAMTGNDIKLSSMQRDSTKAFYQADGGIEKAMWYLNTPVELGGKGMTWTADSDAPLHEGNLTEYFEVIVSPATSPPNEIKTLVSKGTMEGGGKYKQGRVVEVKLKKGIKRSPNLHYDYAVLTDGDMTINGGVSFHGNIHSNSNLTNHGTINMEYGTATATGTTNYGTGNQPYQDFPHIAWDYYESISKKQESIDGHIYNNYYSGDVDFDSSDTLYGVHFVDGNVTITSNELILHDATIFATGYIEIKTGNTDVILENSEGSNPLALVAKGYIGITGNATITGDGIIQTEDIFNLGGTVNIKGAIYADDGIFGGGGAPGSEEEGPESFNVYYDTDLTDIVVPGTGIPVWVKISWREI